MLPSTKRGSSRWALAGVGVGAPGNIDPETGVVSQVANIEGWDAPFPLGQTLADDLERPVVIGNDANAGVAAEHRFGAGRGFDSLLGVFWGTGVGGGLIVDGRILVGRGSAGEIGHICSKPGGRRCNCGLDGCVEAYAGRGALEERARELAKEHDTVLFELMEKRGRDRLTSGVWLRALEAGDKVAEDLIGRAVQALGVGIGSAVTLLDVEAVVIGGGLGERLGAEWLSRIEAAAGEHTFFHDRPEFRLAELGDLGGAIGATHARRVKSVIVTGAGRGIGAAIARRLYADGWAVVAADLDAGAVTELCAELGRNALPVLLDVRDPSGWARAVEVAQAAGDLTALVNCAARTDVRELFEIEPDEWDDVLATNLRGPFLGIRAVGPLLRAAGSGRIVNVSSDSAFKGRGVTGAHYATSKAGLLALTRRAAAALASAGVTVNAVAPGTIDGETVRELAGDRIDELVRRGAARTARASRRRWPQWSRGCSRPSPPT